MPKFKDAKKAAAKKVGKATPKAAKQVADVKGAMRSGTFVKKECGLCSHEITVKEATLKCRNCKHCIRCQKDLKTGGGRHRLCPYVFQMWGRGGVGVARRAQIHM